MLTKPLGVGAITTAVKRDAPGAAEALPGAVEVMAGIEAVRAARPAALSVTTRAGEIEESYRALVAAIDGASVRP